VFACGLSWGRRGGGARGLPVLRFAFGMSARLGERVDQRVEFVLEETDVARTERDRLEPWNFLAGDVGIGGGVKAVVFFEFGLAAGEAGEDLLHGEGYFWHWGRLRARRRLLTAQSEHRRATESENG